MNHNCVITLPAEEALTAHTLVRVTQTGGIKVAAAASNGILGTVLQDTANAADADVYLMKGGGFHYVTAAGAIAVGDAVKGDATATGKVITHGGVGTALGIALQAASADGEVIRVLFTQGAGAGGDAAA